MKKLIAIGLSIGIMGSLAGCGLLTKTEKGIAATVVAKINDQNITRGEFDKKFGAYLDQIKLFYGEDYYKQITSSPESLKGIKEQYLGELVDEALLMQKVNAANVIDESALKDEVDKKYKEAVEYYKGEAEFLKKLEESDMTVEQLRENYKKEVLIQKFQESVVKDVAVADADVQKHYDENKYSYTEKPNTMNISHILVDSEAKAKEIKEKLDKGEKFEDLAKANTMDTATKEQGGLLGDIDYVDNDLDQKFFLNAVTVPVGKVSAPFSTNYGWHIVKMNSKEEYPVKSFDSVKEEIKKTLLTNKQNEKYSAEFTKWKEEAKIKTYVDRL